ncbi:MAG TPA: hypothetical protein VGG76_07340 [Gemmatimonadaceae bacterium]|jgi:hypothetical protein
MIGILLAGCADQAGRILGPRASADVATNSESIAQPTEERAALTRVAQLVARSLDNEPARQHLKRDMRAAPFREHKLELAPYLRSKDGKALFDRMASLAGGEQALLETIAKVRRLEFYMPVAAQRETWTGKSDIVVVSQLDESEPIVSFDSRGNPVGLDRNAAPSTPALSIVPVETNFNRPMPAATSRNARDRNGESIGTLEPMSITGSSLVACGETCGGGGGGSPPPIPPGLYLEYSRIIDAKEPWFRGDPEIEVHIHGPTYTSSPTYGEDLSCSGEHAADYRKVFDQNGAFWEGRVMLYSAEETQAYISSNTQGFHVFFWEDDNEPCVLKLDNNTLLNLVHSAANAFSTVSIKLIPKASWPVVAGAFIATMFSNAGSWMLTNDDFLGIAVDQASAGYAYPGNTHVIMDGTTLNGRATIVYR